MKFDHMAMARSYEDLYSSLLGKCPRSATIGSFAPLGKQEA
jgi:hypothetical protein